MPILLRIVFRVHINQLEKVHTRLITDQTPKKSNAITVKPQQIWRQKSYLTQRF